MKRSATHPRVAAGQGVPVPRPGAMVHIPTRHHRTLMQLASLLLLAPLLVLVLSGKARADCLESTGNANTVMFSFPGTITVPNNVAPGTILAYSKPTQPSNPQAVLWCFGTTNSGITNDIGAQPVNNNTLYPTGIAGLSYRILHPDTSSPLHAYPYESVSPGYYPLNVASVLQLVATGNIANGSQLSGQIAQWDFDLYQKQCHGNSGDHGRGNNCQYVRVAQQPVLLFNISSVRFVSPACSITTDPTNVTLPTVLSSQFSGMGSTTGTTPFAVQLNCSNPTTLTITLQTNSPVNGATGVIASTSGAGYAQGVGVQLLDHNAQPVQFGTPISVAGVQNGGVSIPFSARYYQTGVVSGGQVNATATYTINYP
jgi:type 1 fimbria pilin